MSLWSDAKAAFASGKAETADQPAPQLDAADSKESDRAATGLDLNEGQGEHQLPEAKGAVLESDLEAPNLTGNDALGRKGGDEQVVMLGQEGEQLGDTELPEEAVADKANSAAMTQETEEKQAAAFEIDTERDVMDAHISQHRQMGAFDIAEDWAHSQGVAAPVQSHGQAQTNDLGHDASHSLGYGR